MLARILIAALVSADALIWLAVIRSWRDGL